MVAPDASLEKTKERVKQLTQRVGELERMEQALREAGTLAKLLEFAPHAVFLLDLSGRVVFANNTGATHLGRSINEILGSALRDYFPTDVSENRVLKGMEAIRLKKPVSFEDRAADRWYYNTVYPIMNDRDEVTHLAIYGVDITDRKGAERSLKESEMRYRLIAENTDDVIWTLDVASKRFTYVSPSVEKLRGYTADEVMAQPMEEALTPDSLQTVTQMLPERLSAFYAGESGMKVWRNEIDQPHKNGSIVRTEVVTTLVANKQGQVTEILGVTRDITDRKRAEDALRLGEEKMRSIFSAAPIGIGVVVHRVFTEVNQRFCDMTGYARDELINQSARMIYPTVEDFELVGREKYLQIAESGAGTVETRLKRKDGSVVHVLMSSTPIDATDLSRGVTFTALDITERKRAEEEREALQAQLLQAQKMEAVGRLAGGMAHDLNNLLSPILGFGEILQLDIAQNDARRRAVDEIVQAAFRAKDVIRQMLAFSRKQNMVIKVADLNEVVMGFAKLLRRTIREDIEIQTFSAPDLPSVRVDVGQIEQVIMNLTVNAQDAMPDGGTLTLRMGPTHLDEDYCARHIGSKPGRYAILSVSDTGCGMDRETTQHIFEPFFTTKGEYGTGLGLATVYGIVRQHDGHISVDSEIGKGTTFRIYLPATSEAASETASVVKGTIDLQGNETVLVVEDHDQIRMLTQAILQRLGYRVLLAKDGREALSVLEKSDGPVDLLLTDVVMPDMNGRELFERTSSHRPSLKVLYMSGYSGDVLSHRGVVEEGVQIIQKPFSVQGLAGKVREVLDRP